MAKGKNATALFDVIHAAKKPPKSSPSAAMPTPRWWAKDKKKLNSTTVPPVGETAGKQTSWLAALKKNPAAVQPTAASAVPVAESPVGQDSRPAEPSYSPPAVVEARADSPADPSAGHVETVPQVPPETPAAESVPAQAPVTSVRWMPRAQPAVFAPRPAPSSAAEPAQSESDETPPLVAEVRTRFADRVKPGTKRPDHAEPPVAAVDRDAREVRFRFSYAGLIGLAMIVVLAMTLAFIVGGRVASLRSDAGKTRTPASGSGPSVAATSTTNATLSAVGPVNSSVRPAATTGTPPFRPAVTDVGPRPAAGSTKPAVTVTPTARTTPGAAKAPIDNPRVPGRLYIVIRSYPDTDGDAARKTCDLLTANGIPCSVVRGLKNDVPRGWYSVVGYQPFASVDAADCIAYCKQLDALRPKFAGRMIPRRESELYRWSADAEQN